MATNKVSISYTKFNRGKCPCQHCEERTAECHAICDKYKEWSEKKEQFYARKKSEIEVAEFNHYLNRVHYARRRKKGTR